MKQLTTPQAFQQFLTTVKRTAGQHPREYVRAAIPLINHVTTALLEHGDLAADWPIWATAGRGPSGVGAQLRFLHGTRYLKLRWDHPLKAAVLAVVDGKAEGATLATFLVTDTAEAVSLKMRAGLRLA
jgi:hypothetical protein